MAWCIHHDTVLEALPLETLKQYSDVFDQDVYEAVALENCVARRTSLGGPASVEAQIAAIKAYLSQQKTDEKGE